MTQNVSATAATVSAVAGIWVMVAPGILEFGDPASSVHHVIGPIAASFSVIGIWRVTRSTIRANILTGLLLAVSPALEPHAALANANAVISGLVIMALSVVPIGLGDGFAGGWIGLWRRF